MRRSSWQSSFGLGGLQQIVLRVDGENLIISVADLVAEKHNFHILHDNSRRYDAKGKGAIENASKQLEGHIRADLLGFVRRSGLEVVQDSPLISWIVRHAGWVLTPFAMQSDR